MSVVQAAYKENLDPASCAAAKNFIQKELDQLSRQRVGASNVATMLEPYGETAGYQFIRAYHQSIEAEVAKRQSVLTALKQRCQQLGHIHA